MARRSTADTHAGKTRIVAGVCSKIDGREARFEEVLARIRLLSTDQRQILVTWGRSAIASRSFLAHETNRVRLAKILVALIPKSYDLIRSALTCERLSYCREMQFSLFCYLDEIQTHCPLREYKREVLKLIFQYVINVKSNQAFAAWMAGDLLGDHWELDEAIRVVRKASRLVRYPAGKAALAHATSQIEKRIRSDEDSKAT